MSVKFEDNSIKVKAALNHASIQWLYEASGELEAQVKRNTRVDTGQTKGSWTYKVDEANGEAMVGSPQENAIWEEFGTGQYALNGDGRRGGWYIPEEKLSVKAKSKMKKVIGKNGKVFYYTTGKKPTRALNKAFNSSKVKLKKLLEAMLKGMG